MPAPSYSTRRKRLGPPGRYRLALAVLAPVLGLVAFSAYVVYEKLETYGRSADLLVAAQVARAAQGLARELENERSLSALYVGADRQAWREDLEEQRIATDERAAAFRTVVLTPKGSALFGAERTDLGLGTLDALRAEVSGDSDLHSVLDGYDRLITTMVSSSSKLPTTDLSALIAAYVDLGQMKDRVGRERAIGASWLQQQRAGRDLLRRFSEADAERKAFAQSFRTHASVRQLEIFDSIVGGPVLDEVRRLHDLMRAGALTQADAESWSNAHAQLGTLLGRAEQRLASEMEEGIRANLLSAQIAFYLVVVGVVALVVFSLETLRRSERRAAIAEEEARKLFRAVEQSPVSVMITDTDGLIEYVNPAFTHMTGFGREEVRGHNPRFLRSPLTPETLYADMWQTIGAGQDWRGEIVNQRRDGSAYWEQMRVAPVKGPDGAIENYIAIKEDVTEVRSLRQAVEREHANVRRLIEAIRDAIALTDDQGRFEYANPALVEQFGAVEGRAASEVFGETLPAPRADRSTNRLEWRSPQTGRIYDLTTTWVSQPDGAASLLRVFHDVTVRKQAEEALTSAREAAELANRAKSEFLATMSHELRTPLNAIIGFSEIIGQELLGPIGQQQYGEYAHDINRSGRHLLQLINDILDVARLEVGRVALREEAIDLATIVQSCIAMVRERADTRAIELVSIVPASTPCLWADSRRIKQILVNVLGNAVKFSPENGKVTVTVHADDGGMKIAVADTGIGIAAADIAKVMAPFGQVDSGMARRYGGSGLGLPLSRSLMELHGGTLNLSSEIGKGTTVTLWFPAERLRQAA